MTEPHCKRSLANFDESLTDTQVTKKSKNTYSILQRSKCMIIRNFWRKYFLFNTTFRLAKAFTDKGLLIDTLRTKSFSATITLLKESETIHVVRRCFMRVLRLTTLLHGKRHYTKAPNSINVKVFLSSYLIYTHPTKVFESMGDLETNLFESAQKLSSNFEVIIKALTFEKIPFHAIPHELTKSFLELLFDFIDCFNKFKVADEAKIVGRIKRALVALLEAHNYMPLHEVHNNDGFVKNLRDLQTKLVEIGGPNSWGEIEQKYPEITKILQIPSNNQVISTHSEFQVKCMTIQEMAHELLLKPSFQITEAMACGCMNSTTERIRESFHQAFWQSLEDDLQLLRPCYARILRILLELRDGIAEIAGGEQCLKVKQLVDIDFIRDQFQKKIFDWVKVTEVLTRMIEIIKKVQSTSRDTETSNLWEERRVEMVNALHEPDCRPTAFCKALSFLYGRLNAIRVDFTNARLRLIAPFIQNHGINYERNIMRERLQSGDITLKSTRAWLKESMLLLIKDFPGLIQQVAQGARSPEVYASAVVNLIGNKELSMPETFLLDTHRIRNMRAQYQRLVFYAVVLVTVKNSVGNSAVEEEIVTSFEAESEKDWKDHCISIGAAAVESDRLHSYMDTIQKLLADPTEPVHALMHTQVRAFLESALGGVRGAEVDELCQGLKTMANKWVEELKLASSLNFQVHQHTYDSLMQFVAIEAMQ